ncbi:MAG: hypothetical protein ACRD8K_12545 [Nitrososphaeraceae archaeon]
MIENEETINTKIKIIVVILFTIITITVIHILINEGMAKEQGVTLINPINVTNETFRNSLPVYKDMLTGI